MESLEGVGKVGGWELLRGPSLVVGPQRDGEAIALVNKRFDPGLQSRRRGPGGGELLGQLNLEGGSDLFVCRCDSGEYVTGQKT